MQRVAPWVWVVTAIVAVVGLWFHARSYDFFADDAFITLRYGQFLWEHGAPVYNLGERVEGYTSPLWMVLAAGAHGFGDPVSALQVFGGVAGCLWLAGLVRMWSLLRPRSPAGGALVLLATSMACPVAGWAMGGLETPLFGALLTWSIAEAGPLVRQRFGYRRAIFLGVLLALTTFARPEGGLVAIIVGGSLLALRLERVRWRAPVITMSVYAVLVGAHVLWRFLYYGYPLPNTFYLKSSGEADALVERGFGYIKLAASELGWPLVALIAVGLLFPVLRDRGGRDGGHQATRRAILWSAKLLVIAFVPYVIRIGGDFLDLYRFFAPILPLGFVLVAAAGHELVIRLRVPWPAMLAAGVLLVGLHGYNQWQLRDRALNVHGEQARKKQGVEPLWWTRLYARRWAAIGRWIHSVAKPDDWMAVGAAGAMPYYAGISNLYTFGLCDEFVAHHGATAGSRPGHQRFAPFDYMMRRRPTFVFVGDFSRNRPMRTLNASANYRRLGYRLVEAYITTEAFGAPEPFFHYLYMRGDRAVASEGKPNFRAK